MTPTEHYEAAEKLVHETRSARDIEIAQVHATLATVSRQDTSVIQALEVLKSTDSAPELRIRHAINLLKGFSR